MSKRSGQIKIPFNLNTIQQEYFYQWQLDSLKLLPGDKIEYFIQVSDNDGVNGPKSTKTLINEFHLPDKEEMEKTLEAQSLATSSKMNGALNESQKLKKEINEIENRLKAKKNLDYQDKKMLEELIKKKKEQSENVEQLQKDFDQLKEKRDKYAEESPKLSEK